MDGKLHELYETDFYAWTQQQAALLLAVAETGLRRGGFRRCARGAFYLISFLSTYTQ